MIFGKERQIRIERRKNLVTFSERLGQHIGEELLTIRCLRTPTGCLDSRNWRPDPEEVTVYWHLTKIKDGGVLVNSQTGSRLRFCTSGVAIKVASMLYRQGDGTHFESGSSQVYESYVDDDQVLIGDEAILEWRQERLVNEGIYEELSTCLKAGLTQAPQIT